MSKESKLHPIDYSPYFAPAAAVEIFMQAAGHLSSTQKPYERQFDSDTVRLYFKFVKEEYIELCEAMIAYDDALLDKNPQDAYQAFAEVLDGCHDLIWVTIGMLLASGYPIQAGWHEVANSNLAKIDRTTQAVKRREDGKILKPDGWKPPDFLSLIEAHLQKRIKI